ncbi:AraC family transcriptional regulator [Streptomyces sp. NPDC060334]|uniref:AraC family transcriptional regulator n=1 Tax=unclassified Streptomyces TaxID=2593676 RepID=UPI002258C8AB|nr:MULTISPECIES: helix-turn-helix transcriptional regulator [unclassified Streptomyces]MCX5072396.1 helix-turn-helix transcriptional regulator [Streptomyces sp. NBC_00424]MCX5156940.1 helix-turn-helix transcriptional regulator [Streptomyces sp. NBC_00291]WUD44262.1 helix-turn-helix transcriptional regulator [Streptomyces sp. NBC_00513]
MQKFRQPDAEHRPRALTNVNRLDTHVGIPAHHHDDHQIAYAGSGMLSVTTDAGTWVAPTTRALWIPAGTVHEHRAYGRTDLHCVGLPTRHAPLPPDRPAVIAVGPLLRELILAYTREPDDGSPARRRLLVVLLDRLRVSPLQPLHLPAPTDPRLAAVCAVLEADPADGRGLAALGAAAGAGAGERTLSRLFRADLGMTFPQWRTQLRLHQALRLLAVGTPVTAVAHRCGWSSASAFIDVFRRAFGHTPGTHL